MASSCGNPETEKDAEMLRRPKFDKSKDCVRCKLRIGNVVIRHAVYCKECFVPLITTKFRKSLEPFVNEIPDGPRRKALKASGDLLVALSGGLSSTVLLDLVDRCYFSVRSAPTENETGKVNGGRDHPRNSSVWRKAYVCYVDVCAAIPDTKHGMEVVRSHVEKYPHFEFIPLRIEDAFDHDWWKKIDRRPARTGIGLDVNDENLFLTHLSDESSTSSPICRLQNFLASLPTQTAVSNAIRTLVRLLLLYTASYTNSSHLLLGTSLTSLSISLISSISQGAGFVVREEAQEEWTPNCSDQVVTTRRPIRVIRPLKDVGLKECGIWAWWNDVYPPGREKMPGEKQNIETLTEDFIVRLERDYPSTVSTIARTCAKLAPKAGAEGVCLFCERPLQSGIQDWKAQISMRSLNEREANALQSKPSLTPFLCYSCHTTLTSRSSRGRSGTSASHGSVTLPLWLESSLSLLESYKAIGVADEVWTRKKMTDSKMKAAIDDFLLPDE